MNELKKEMNEQIINISEIDSATGRQWGQIIDSYSCGYVGSAVVSALGIMAFDAKLRGLSITQAFDSIISDRGVRYNFTGQEEGKALRDFEIAIISYCIAGTYKQAYEELFK